MDDGFPDKPMSMTETAEWLGVKYTWLSTQVAAGRVPCTRLGKRVKFFPAHLRLIMENGIDVNSTPELKVRPVRRRRESGGSKF